jgi:hypothetical protein
MLDVSEEAYRYALSWDTATICMVEDNEARTTLTLVL